MNQVNWPGNFFQNIVQKEENRSSFGAQSDAHEMNLLLTSEPPKAGTR